MGLKQQLLEPVLILLVSSNRTIVGLKRRYSLSISTPRRCSNRTIVGLKLNFLQGFVKRPVGSNRTIVGLKLAKENSDQWGSEAAIAPLWD